MIETKLLTLKTGEQFCSMYRSLKVQYAENYASEQAAIEAGDSEKARLYAEKTEKVSIAISQIIFEEVERLWGSYALDGYGFPVETDVVYHGRVLQIEYEAPPFDIAK